MGDVVVRMGELAVSTDADDVLVSVGLGSCIGLALISETRRFKGCALAHVMLPSGTEPALPGKFAATAPRALVERLASCGVPSRRLQAVLVGGAQMFKSASSMDIGSRNEAAVRAELQTLGIPVVAAATGGTVGRTIRVHVATGEITFAAAAGTPVALIEGESDARALHAGMAS